MRFKSRKKSVSWSVMYDIFQPCGLSMEFSREEYWSGLPFPSPGDLHDPGIKLRSPALQADCLPSELTEKPVWFQNNINCIIMINIGFQS